MGLSISHYKLVSEPVIEGDYILADEWEEDCNLPICDFENYLTSVKTYHYGVEFAIFESDGDYDLYLKTLDTKPEFEQVFIGKVDEKLKKQMAQHLKAKKLTSLERLDLEVNADGLKYQTISFGEPKFEKGFYYVEEGYQKHGMVNLFWDEFSKYSFYGTESDFLRAFELLDIDSAIKNGNPKAAKILTENFKMGFLSKYEFGRSLLAV